MSKAVFYRWFRKQYPIVIQSERTDQCDEYYYLFARTNRDKEYWFNKLYDFIARAKGIRKEPQEDTYGAFLARVFNVSETVLDPTDEASVSGHEAKDR